MRRKFNSSLLGVSLPRDASFDLLNDDPDSTASTGAVVHKKEDDCEVPRFDDEYSVESGGNYHKRDSCCGSENEKDDLSFLLRLLRQQDQQLLEMKQILEYEQDKAKLAKRQVVDYQKRQRQDKKKIKMLEKNLDDMQVKMVECNKTVEALNQKMDTLNKNIRQESNDKRRGKDTNNHDTISETDILSLLAAGVTLDDLKASRYPQHIQSMFEEAIKDSIVQTELASQFTDSISEGYEKIENQVDNSLNRSQSKLLKVREKQQQIGRLSSEELQKKIRFLKCQSRTNDWLFQRQNEHLLKQEERLLKEHLLKQEERLLKALEAKLQL